MLTEKDYCDYDTCVALKELGFNEKCHRYYEPLKNCLNTTSIKHGWRNSEVNDIGVIICPTLYEAQKWLREEKRLHIEVRWYCNMWYDYEVKEAEGKVLAEGSAFNTYEDALITAIYMATEHLKEK